MGGAGRAHLLACVVEWFCNGWCALDMLCTGRRALYVFSGRLLAIQCIMSHMLDAL